MICHDYTTPVPPPCRRRRRARHYRRGAIIEVLELYRATQLAARHAARPALVIHDYAAGHERRQSPKPLNMATSMKPILLRALTPAEAARAPAITARTAGNELVGAAASYCKSLMPSNAISTAHGARDERRDRTWRISRRLPFRCACWLFSAAYLQDDGSIPDISS